MQLEHPNLLWLLLPLLPLLWWLSQPPKPRRVLWTAHLLQWQLAMRALQRRPPRGSWLRFVLLAAATTAVLLAVAGPRRLAGDGAERLVVLLDASASMRARLHGAGDGLVQRERAWDRACAVLRDAFGSVPEHVDVTLLRCGGDLRRRHGPAARQLTDVGAPAGALDVDLVALAEALHDPVTAVWTLTDGQGQAALPALGALSTFDAHGPNAAITAVRIDDRWPLPGLTVELDVVAFVGADGTAAELRLEVAGAVTAPGARTVAVESGRPQTVTVAVDRQPAGGVLTLRLRLRDDRLPADDLRELVLPALPAPQIAVLAEDEAGPWAAEAAAALAVEFAGEVVAVDAGERVGLLLVDGGAVPLVPGRVRALTFGTRLDPPAEPEPDGGPEPLPVPGPVEWSRTSPLTRGLDLSELRVTQAWRGLLPEAGEPFLWSEQGGVRTPLAVLVSDERLGTASVHFAFRLADGNLPLLAAFPQLLRRALVAGYGSSAAVGLDAGEPPAPGEQDLREPARTPDRPLPPFATAPEPLASWFVLAGMLLLGLRAFVR